MTQSDAQHDPVGRMLDLLQVESVGARTTEDIFMSASAPMPHGRIFGGQVLAQTVVAAARTLPPERVVHSMHGYFLRPGDASQGLTISVDRIHDGRSFSTRRSQAYQNGAPIFSMISSFQDEGPGLEHQDEAPHNIPAPETLPDAITLSEQQGGGDPYYRNRPFEFRYVDGPVYVKMTGPATPRQAVWVRAKREMPDDPALHRAALAFVSDMTIQDPVLRAHGVTWARPGLKVASLDHAMWWHRPARVDEWLLYVQESPSARGGRGLSTGKIFTRDGELAASIAQEIMVRLPE